ncbi:sensor domain-containing protein [Bacillus sp. B-jedd]|uniref:sensor domain-containing protein n=1 Tax=Bacillus sp. B-jedd TaxID=1476857 RepID=UPI0005156FEF|nr:bifunctional diguanylate cyclase/phosphodiesterase [Bacillus sp. B-jedd]CEG26640.1 PAS/PAC sensor-containing diguanylate cyclase/phosphodiesterase [Bacillus sp. B-jedd]
MKFSNDILSYIHEDGNRAANLEPVIFDLIFTHIKDMVFIMKVEEGPVFRYLFANKSGMRMAGITEDAIGKTFQEALPEEISSQLQREYKKALLNGGSTTVFDSASVSGGELFFGETLLSPVSSADGKVSYIVAITRDVTDYVNEKNNIIESGQRYRSIVDNNMDAIFSISMEGRILEANPAAAKLTGYEEMELLTYSIYDLVSDADFSSFAKLVENTGNGMALESMDCRFSHRNGHPLTLHIKTVPIIVFGDIKGIYVIIRDISEQSKNVEMIKYMAFHDQLTGLLNRRALLDKLNEQLFSPERTRKEFALISIDLDRFKYLNDSLGHLVGDEILKKASSRLLECQNERCFVYRQGGDEFIILLLETSRKATAFFAQRILSMFKRSFYFNSQEYYISPSIGISMYPNDGKDAETLLKNADEALFRVKDRGRAHYQFYRTEMNSTVTNFLAIETHLRKAIEKKELYLHYQPQIDLGTGKARSFEALLRWNSSELGAISPGVFIPLAEDSGLIISIGNWVIDQACKQIRAWNRKGYTDFRVAVNISPKQLQQPNFISYLKSALEKHNVQPSSLEVEITEGSMQNKNEAAPALQSIKKLGVTISVDDFGTGYSSLSYLKQFPIDVLKIDQSFVRDIIGNEKDAAIASAIIHLGRSLGVEVIAEGVETSLQAEFLTSEGCHKAQGYFFSRPVSPEIAEEHYLRHPIGIYLENT